jgi:hypothetical protein
VIADAGFFVNVMIAFGPVMDPAVAFKAFDDIAAVGEHLVNPNQNGGMTKDNVLHFTSHNNKILSHVVIRSYKSILYLSTGQLIKLRY